MNAMPKIQVRRRRRRTNSFKRSEDTLIVYEETIVINEDGHDTADVIADLNKLHAFLEKVLHSVLSHTTQLGETVFADMLVAQSALLIKNRLFEGIVKSTNNATTVKLIPHLQLDFELRYPEKMPNGGYLKASVEPHYAEEFKYLVLRIEDIITEFGF